MAPSPNAHLPATRRSTVSPGWRNGPSVLGADGLGVRPLLPADPGAHRATSHRRLRVAGAAAALVVAAGSVLAAGLGPADATTQTTAVSTAVTTATTTMTTASATEVRQGYLEHYVNRARTSRGLRAYTVSSALSAVAQQQAWRMAHKQQLFHNPNLATDVHSWQALGENVAYTSSVSRAHTLLMHSPPHRANVLSRTFTQVGVGVVKDSHGTVWVVEVFRKPA